MAKNMKNRFQTVAKVENRQICPSCPVTLERAVFVYDYELGNKLIQFVLRNNGDRPVAGAVVRFRCYDILGNCLYPGSAPDSGITYSGLACKPGECFADRRAVKLWSYDIVNYDAWVTQVTFTDGTCLDFSPDDYILRPTRTALREVLDSKEEKAIRGAWGRSARYVPAAVNDTLWSCTCGRLCAEEKCPDCRAMRGTLASHFGTEATQKYAHSLARRRSILRAAIVLTLLIGVLGAAGAGLHYATHTLYPAATTEITERFLAEGRYDEALGFVRKRKDIELEQKVLRAARENALAAADYEKALMYDSILAEPEPEPIYRAAAEAAMAGMAMRTVDFTAAGYGLLTADEALYDELIHGLIEYCEANGLYRQAVSYTKMLHAMNEEALADVFDDAIAKSMARENYDEAFSWAEQHPDSTRLETLTAEIFGRLFDEGDLERALELTERYDEDGDYLAQIYAQADARFIAAHITEFYFSAMSPAERMTWHTQPLAIAKEAAYIDADGRVLGLKDVNWTNAVSLAMNEFHTLCLFADGHVEASGHTGYGRCSVSSWEDVVAVAAGERHSVALKEGGRVLAVGDNSDGQCEVTAWAAMIDIAAGRRHTVALRTDGTVRACGSNESGQCNVEGYDDIIDIAAGDWTTVLLHRDGSVTVLGNTALGISDANDWTDIVDIAAGSSHVLGLRADGTVVMAGQPSFGSAGSVEGWTDVTAIAAGSVCVAGLKADGNLLLSGDGAPELY